MHVRPFVQSFIGEVDLWLNQQGAAEGGIWAGLGVGRQMVGAEGSWGFIFFEGKVRYPARVARAGIEKSLKE